MKLNRKFIITPLFVAALALAGCSSSSDPLDVSDSDTAGMDGGDAGADAGGDAGADAGGDAGADAGGDAGADAGGDAGADAGGDAGADAGGDAGADAGGDAGADAGGDAGADAGGDAGADAGGDTGADAGGDAGADAGGDAGGDADGASVSRAVVASIDPGFTSAVVDLIGTEDPFEVEGNLNPGVSDTIVRAFGDRYFVIRRFMSDSIAAYSIDDPSTPLFEVSTNSDTEEASSNPHDLVFLNAEKAYLLRYGSPIVWVVNPSVTDPAAFKIGEIDLSAYDADGVPEATRGAIVNGNLYVVMQRLEGFVPTQPGYVAVIDTATDTEIDTGTGNGLPGIELPAFNPGDISVDAATDSLFISAFGDFGAFDGSRPAALTGGLVTVDTTDFSATQLIDDNDGTGRMNNVEVATVSRGYLVTSQGFGSTSLDMFNPGTGRIEALGVAGLTGVDIRDIAVGPAGNLWVAIADPESPRVIVINPADNSVISPDIATTQSPASIAFTQ